MPSVGWQQSSYFCYCSDVNLQGGITPNCANMNKTR
uniref:Uncharacterized protein n=1 Tax=Anguilla anguilla TaxID=7936 RepID=A0A0E9S8V7_ANGAN